MNAGKSIFSQLMDFLPSQEFRRCVERYKGDYKLQKLFMLGPIPVHGFCPTNLPRESARHRSVSAGPSNEALSPGSAFINTWI